MLGIQYFFSNRLPTPARFKKGPAPGNRFYTFILPSLDLSKKAWLPAPWEQFFGFRVFTDYSSSGMAPVPYNLLYRFQLPLKRPCSPTLHIKILKVRNHTLLKFCKVIQYTELISYSHHQFDYLFYLNYHTVEKN